MIVDRLFIRWAMRAVYHRTEQEIDADKAGVDYWVNKAIEKSLSPTDILRRWVKLPEWQFYDELHRAARKIEKGL